MSDLYQPAPDVFAAARTRRSIRAYEGDPVPFDIMREVVTSARLSTVRKHPEVFCMSLGMRRAQS